MKISPEFQRNLWLESSPHRLLGMPAILAALFFLIYLSGDGLGHSAATVALVLYLLFTVIWGGKLVSESVISEIRDKTWDAQRMSSISPWAMTWGKLLGSAIFAWYGALICLLLYGYILWPEMGLSVWKSLLLLLGAGLFAQAVGMLLSLVFMRRDMMRTRSISAAYLVFGILAAMPFVRMGILNRGVVQWYGSSYAAQDFLLASVLLFLCWGLLGNYRLMRAELQLRNQPWVWMGFILFMVVYLAGLIHERDDLLAEIITLRLLAAYLIVLTVVYITLFVENKNPVVFRRMLLSVRERRWRRVLEQVPAWMSAMLLAFGLMMLLNTRDFSLLDSVAKGVDPRLFALAGFLFMLRDVGIVLYFNLGRRRQRADVTAMLYLALLYFLLPGILEALNLDMANALLLPWTPSAPITTIMSGLAQVALTGWLLVRRWQRYTAATFVDRG